MRLGVSSALGDVLGEVLWVVSDVFDAVSEAAYNGKYNRRSQNQLSTYPTLKTLGGVYDGYSFFGGVLA